MSTRRGRRKPSDEKAGAGRKPVTLKAVAQYLGLSPATVSVVLNRTPVADSIPRETQERVFEAARKLKYRPNYLARSLRGMRTQTVGVLVPEISEGYAAGVMGGIEGRLLDEGYIYFIASHRADPELVEKYLDALRERRVEGYIVVAAPLASAPGLPTVAVAGHRELEDVTNVAIDHDRATRLALEHLVEFGHERIAFFKGHEVSADTEDRWRSILEAAAALGVEVRPERWLQLSGEFTEGVFTPEEGYREGYEFGKKLLSRSSDFTSLLAFNDISAIGAMRAFQDAGLRVPEDVSVVGFDDIQSAAFHNPSLTTVRQPLHEMGELAARILVRRLSGDGSREDHVTVEPKLMVRESTGPASSSRAGGR